ncbi:MAG: hypothetical protein Ct9H90mP10_01760 [Actinomycetota bacterium]|nr:MAG: hypothetical protein Ct9H90mP10_01760 [Actinomycetota bacterium]
MENILKFSHMLGLSIWFGSMVMWAMFAPKLYKIDPTKNTTNTLRKKFQHSFLELLFFIFIEWFRNFSSH